MPDSGTIDTSMYKDAVSDPFEFQNKLLANQRSQQQVQEENIKLATQRFGLINNAASGLLADPDLGTKDISKKLWDTLGRATASDAMTAQHAVQFAQQFPTDPRQQRQAILAVHAQTLDAWQKGQAYLGQTQGIGTGGGTKFVGAPAFGGVPQDRGFIPNTLQPGTPQVNPDLSQSYVGGTGNPPIQGPAGGGVPPQNIAPRPAVVPRTAPATAPAASPASPSIMAAPPPGEVAAKEKTGGGSGTMLAEERNRASNYRREVYPLEQAIPALERLGKTGTGPGTEQVNQIKSFLQSVGVPGIDINKIKDYDEAHKYLTDWVTANGDHSTNDKLAAAFSSNASTKISNAAAVDVAKSALALRRMKQAQLEQFEATGLPESQYGKWSAKWNREQDPRIYGWDYMSDPQKKNFLQSVSGPKRDLLIMQLHHAADAGFVDPASLAPKK
jgi:hypothetical protein